MGIRRDHSETGFSALSSIESTAPVLPSPVANLSQQTGFAIVDNIDVEDIDPELIRPLSLTLVREQKALPLWERDGVLEVAISDPYLQYHR